MTTKALRRVARALLAEANVAAASMIADRLDGKVPQPTGGSDELGPQRLHISWRGSEPGEEVRNVSRGQADSRATPLSLSRTCLSDFSSPWCRRD